MDFNLFSPELTANPYDLYDTLRSIGHPVKHDTLGFWMVGNYEQATAILRDPGTFSSEAMGSIGRVGEAFARESMSAADPPEHHRLRSVVQRAFTPRAIAELGDLVEQLVKDTLAEIDPGQPFDLIDAIAAPLPLGVIAQMMGVSREHEAAFRTAANDLVVGNSVLATPEQAAAAEEGSRYLRQYFSELIPQRRAQPADDLVSRLIAANEDNRLADNELLAACVFFLFAGIETTTGLIANAALALSQNPEEQARLVANPELMTPAVEEFLRFCGPPQAVLRSATTEVDVAGSSIAKGDFVMVLIGCANRDESVFQRADRLVVDRNPNPHIAFSFGPHFCLGANLARLETKIVIQRLLQCAPAFRLAEPDQPLAYRPGFFLRSLERLNLVF
jgi:cytochrome P450